MNTLFHVIHYRNEKMSHSFELETKTIEWFDLTMVAEGRLSYIINNQPVILEAGDAILLPPGATRSRIGLKEKVHYISFNFHTKEKINLPLIMRHSVTPEILSLFNAFTPRLVFGPSSEINAPAKASHILGYILEVFNTAYQLNTQNPHVLNAIKYIKLNIEHQISLSDIATHLNLSREYTASLFKKETGMSVSSYINERKLALACDLIRNRELSLADIAKACGYENYGYFSRVFKQRFGISPKKFSNQFKRQ